MMVFGRATVASSLLILAAATSGLAQTPAPAPDATLTISSASIGGLGLTLVEGLLRFRGKKYLLTLRGAEPGPITDAQVYGLRRVRDIEGAYRETDGVLRNERGVTLRFEAPLRVSPRGLTVSIESQMYPKASTGQSGNVE